jgi:hypothetical protein
MSSSPEQQAPTGPVDLDEVQRLCDAATPGPWEIHERFAETIWRGEEIIVDSTSGLADTEFIAAARDLLPRMAAELRAAREVIAQVNTHCLSFSHPAWQAIAGALADYDQAVGGGMS